MEPHPSSRPTSLAIPKSIGAQGPYCPRRPGLSDILANNAPPPWSLSAFMAYLSQNHCLETLEFTMDSSRYRKHYNKLAGRAPGGQLVPGSQDAVFIKNLWGKLVEAYIAPNGAREVNLPSYVRDDILARSEDELPPHPSTLDTAVDKIHELMEDSVLVPFLNSFNHVHSHDANGDTAMTGTCEDNHDAVARSYDDRASHRASPRMSKRASPTLSGSPPTFSASYNPQSSQTHSHRISAPTSFGQFSNRASAHHSRHSHTPTSASDPAVSFHSRPSSTATSARNSAAVLNSEGYSSLASPVSSKHNSTQHVSSLSQALAQQPQSQQHSHLHPSLQALVAADSPADLTDAASSSPSMAEPMTPPTTPPMCDNAAFVTSPAGFRSPQPGLSGIQATGQNTSAWNGVNGSQDANIWPGNHHGSISSNASLGSLGSSHDRNGSSTWRKVRNSFGFSSKKRHGSREREEEAH